MQLNFSDEQNLGENLKLFWYVNYSLGITPYPRKSLQS